MPLLTERKKDFDLYFSVVKAYLNIVNSIEYDSRLISLDMNEKERSLDFGISCDSYLGEFGLPMPIELFLRFTIGQKEGGASQGISTDENGNNVALIIVKVPTPIDAAMNLADKIKNNPEGVGAFLKGIMQDEYVKSELYHELTHLFDRFKYTGSDIFNKVMANYPNVLTGNVTAKDMVRYVNHPFEMTAFYQQAAGVFRDDWAKEEDYDISLSEVVKDPDKIRKHVQYFIDEYLSPDFVTLLLPKNRKKIIRWTIDLFVSMYEDLYAKEDLPSQESMDAAQFNRLELDEFIMPIDKDKLINELMDGLTTGLMAEEDELPDMESFSYVVVSNGKQIGNTFENSWTAHDFMIKNNINGDVNRVDRVAKDNDSESLNESSNSFDNLLKKSINLKLNEGRYDRIVTQMSRKFIEELKTDDDNLIEFDMMIHNNILVHVRCDIDHVENKDKEFSIGGETGPDDGPTRTNDAGYLIDLYLEFGNSIPNTVLNNLIPELKEVFRHEIEHIQQYQMTNGDMVEDYIEAEDDYVGYLTQPIEIPAFVHGIYKKAKTLKQPFDVVAWETIMSFSSDYSDMSYEEQEHVFGVWLNYAKKHLPAAQFDQD